MNVSVDMKLDKKTSTEKIEAYAWDALCDFSLVCPRCEGDLIPIGSPRMENRRSIMRLAYDGVCKRSGHRGHVYIDLDEAEIDKILAKEDLQF